SRTGSGASRRGGARCKQTPGCSLSAYCAVEMRSACQARWRGFSLLCRSFSFLCEANLSLVQPYVLVAIAVIRAVHHHGDALYIRVPAGASTGVQDDRPRDVLLNLLVDFPDQLLALLHIGFLVLHVEHLFDSVIAVVG